MEAVFMTVLNMSLSASVVILAVLPARLVLRNAPKKWSYLLWSVVGFRLCCPVSLKAAFSIFRLPVVRPGIAPEALQAIRYIPPDIGQSAVPQVTLGTPAMRSALSAALPAPALGDSASPLQIWIAVGTAAWLTGLAALLGYSIIRWLLVRRRLMDAVLLENSVFLTDRIDTPFILGALRPKIYLPAGLEKPVMEAVTAHERSHLRHRDPAVKLLAWLLLATHWFNPLVWTAFFLMVRDMEMRCDEEVLAGGSISVKTYSMSLLCLASKKAFSLPGSPGFGEPGVKARIRNSLRWRKSRLWVTAASVALAAVLIAACGTNPPSQEISGPLGITVREVRYELNHNVPTFYVTCRQKGGYGALVKEGSHRQRVWLHAAAELFYDGAWQMLNGLPLACSAPELPEGREVTLAFTPDRRSQDMFWFFPQADQQFRLCLSVIVDYGNPQAPDLGVRPDQYELPSIPVEIPESQTHPQPLLTLRSGDETVTPFPCLCQATYVTADGNVIRTAPSSEPDIYHQYAQERAPRLRYQGKPEIRYGDSISPGGGGLQVFDGNWNLVLTQQNGDMTALEGLGPGEYWCALSILREGPHTAPTGEREQASFDCLFRLTIEPVT